MNYVRTKRTESSLSSDRREKKHEVISKSKKTMKANVIYKGVRYDNVELGSIKQDIVSFRIHTDEPTYNEDIEQLVNDGADVDFYKEYAFVIVSRKDASEIIWL